MNEPKRVTRLEHNIHANHFEARAGVTNRGTALAAEQIEETRLHGRHAHPDHPDTRQYLYAARA
jgi:hypothetical protein